MPKNAGGKIPLVELVRDVATALHQQLFEGLRALIVSGRMAPGTRLPATRSLARDLNVSRTTVLEAFRRLRSEGYVESRVGDGTYVATTLPESATRAVRPRPTGQMRSTRVRELPRVVRCRLSERGARIHTTAAPSLKRDEPRAFQPGVPALDEFPQRLWWGHLDRAVEESGSDALHYPDPAGYAPLRSAVADQLRVSRGLRCSADQVVITTGSQQALSVLARLLVDPGDAVWLEDPGYPGARRALLAAGARPVPVPVDSEGMDIRAGENLESRPVIVYVTPSHQFPLGITMSKARRTDLLEWADAHDVWVIEDDYDGEYRFEGRPLPALQGMDDAGRVLYVGTFSKMLFPALRLGYVVLPGALVEAFLAVRAVSDEAPPPALQIAAAGFLDHGDFARHIRRMRTLYQERRDALVESLTRECGESIRLGPTNAGMHFSLRLPNEVQAHDVSADCEARGVTAFALSAFAGADVFPNGLVLGFGGYSPGEIRRATRILADVIHTRAPRRARFSLPGS